MSTVLCPHFLCPPAVSLATPPIPASRLHRLTFWTRHSGCCHILDQALQCPPPSEVRHGFDDLPEELLEEKVQAEVKDTKGTGDSQEFCLGR